MVSEDIVALFFYFIEKIPSYVERCSKSIAEMISAEKIRK
jgi:hypothetical protein